MNNLCKISTDLLRKSNYQLVDNFATNWYCC